MSFKIVGWTKKFAFCCYRLFVVCFYFVFNGLINIMPHWLASRSDENTTEVENVKVKSKVCCS